MPDQCRKKKNNNNSNNPLTSRQRQPRTSANHQTLQSLHFRNHGTMQVFNSPPASAVINLQLAAGYTCLLGSNSLSLPSRTNSTNLWHHIIISNNDDWPPNGKKRELGRTTTTTTTATYATTKHSLWLLARDIVVVCIHIRETANIIDTAVAAAAKWQKPERACATLEKYMHILPAKSILYSHSGTDLSLSFFGGSF